jgi:predicted nucleic acid-binding protein
MDAKIEYHVKQHVEVLHQYMNNTTTSHPTLIKMFVRILIKFFKKQYLERALDIWFERENVQPADKIAEKIKRLRSLLSRKFDIELVDLIIGDIVKYYKIKETK